MRLGAPALLIWVAFVLYSTSCVHAFENEFLDQFMRFRDLTGSDCPPFPENITSSIHGEDEDTVYHISSAMECVRSFYAHRIYRHAPKYCRAFNWEHNAAEINTTHPELVVESRPECMAALHKLSARTESDARAQQCTYTIEKGRHGGSYIIRAADGCKAAKGGSSFDVDSEGPNETCTVKYDPNTTAYDVMCPSSQARCVRAVLDFENFDAFNDVLGAVLPPLRAPLTAAATEAFLCNAGDAEKSKETETETETDKKNRAATATASDLSLRVDGTEEERAATRKCYLESRESYFLGDSHLRYLFDAAVLTFGSEEERKKLHSLPHHHGFVSFNSSTYYPFHFSNQLARVLHDDFCRRPQASAGKAVTLIISPGSWDLDYMGVREVLSHGMADTLVDSIRDMVLGTATDANCTLEMKLVVVTAPPYPLVDPNSSTGGDHGSGHHHSHHHSHQQQQQQQGASNGAAWKFLGGGYRNRYSVGALNEYFTMELGAVMAEYQKRGGGESKSKSSRVQLQVVDGFNLVPGLGEKDAEQHVCGFHHLCLRKPKDGEGKHSDMAIEATRAGNVLFNKVINPQVLCE